MLSQRVQRQIERLLDEADEAAARRDWATVRERVEHVLTFDPDNADARAFLAAAGRGLATTPPAGEPSAVGATGGSPSGPPSPGGRELERGGVRTEPTPTAHPEPVEGPTSFASGRYAVRRFLGEGGKKRVYLAHDTLLDREVAFALIKTEGLDKDGRERVRREAQAMGRLTSPHIVTVFEVGSEGDAPYMVTELLRGGFVEDAIEKADDHKLSLERVVDIAQQVCQGLEVAHQRGVVHRDLKPGNVGLMVEGTVKIADFGLAVAVDRSRLTQAGMMVGTVSYMPPEQALGGEITARSDLYSVGCMLYEMVTGRPPFVGDDNVAIIGQHLNTPPVSPSWHRPELPRGLETLILRLLEKDPNKRPASAAEVRQALAGIDPHPSPLPEGEGTVARGEGAIADNPLYRRTFVGREAELRQLQSAFDAAISGQGSLAMVVGEPGIGKTALVEQLATYVSLRGGHTLVGHCYEEGSLSLPYLAFVEAMRSYVLAREPDALRSELGTGAADVARIVSEIRDRVQVELRPPGDPEDDRWRLFQSVTSFLRNASQVQPLLIVLEDLHWADRGTLDLLTHIARNLQGARLTVVGTYRDVEVDRAHPLSGTLAELSRTATFNRIRLRGLSIDEVQRMISNIRGQEVSWARAEMYYRQTEGNPLFIQELLRYLVEEGLVVREGGRYALADPSRPEAGVPEGLRDVIGKRLSRLSPECNRLLAVAAVIGRDFNLATLHVVAGVSDEAVMSGLEEAVRVGVLEERSRLGAVSYRFGHAFFRQTLYEEMIAPRRLRLHQEVARALESEYGSRREDHAAELAEHFAQSTDKTDLAKAVEYGEQAAQRAMSVFDYGEAARLLERALGAQEVLDPDDKAKRCDLLLALGEALMPAGEPLRAAEEIAEEALALAETVSDSRRASHACQIGLQGLFRYGGATMMLTPSFRRWAEQANRYATPGTTERVYADLGLAGVGFAQRDWAGSWTLMQRALKLARQLDDVEATFSAAYRIMWPAAAHHQEELRKIAEEFSSRDEQGVSTRTLAWLLRACGDVFLSWGERERTEALWHRLAELAQRTQDAHLLIFSHVNEVVLATLDGELDEAVELGARLIARSDELGSPVFGRQFYGTAHRALLYRGRGEEALGVVYQARRLAGLPDPSQRPDRTALLALVGRLAEAREALRQFMTEQVIHEVPAGMLANLLEAAVLVEDHGAAKALADNLKEVAALVIPLLGPTSFGRHLGTAAAILGKPDEARGYYHQALEVCAKVRFRPEIALTRLQLAELLLEHYPDERAEALDHLDFAIAEFREMKMQPSLERALRHRGLLRA